MPRSPAHRQSNRQKPRRKQSHASIKSAEKRLAAPLDHEKERPHDASPDCVVTARDINLAGQGVAVAPDGLTVFVSDLLPGESGEVQIIKKRKQYASARLLNRLTQAPDRVAPRCPIAKSCGACTLQHLAYSAQLQYKTQLVRQTLLRVGKFPAEQVDAALRPCLGMEKETNGPWHYRSKIQLPAAPGPIFGYYRANSHEILPFDHCFLQPPIVDQIRQLVIQQFSTTCTQHNALAALSPLLRHLVVRLGFATGEVMVVLVLQTAKLPASAQRLLHDTLAPILEQALQELEGNWKLASLQINLHPEENNRILGDENHLIWGSPTILERLDGLAYEISPHSFFQVNPRQAEVLFGRVVALASLKGTETVLDLYCGTGSISLWLARKAQKVYGVEIEPAAIRDAKRNAQRNGLSERTDFRCGTAEGIAPELIRVGVRPEVVVVDPPRKGCDPALLDTILTVKPDRIVYVSCNPATLARDLTRLVDGGYRLQVVEPVDLFPQTTHVETVCLMTRGES